MSGPDYSRTVTEVQSLVEQFSGHLNLINRVEESSNDVIQEPEKPIREELESLFQEIVIPGNLEDAQRAQVIAWEREFFPRFFPLIDHPTFNVVPTIHLAIFIGRTFESFFLTTDDIDILVNLDRFHTSLSKLLQRMLGSKSSEEVNDYITKTLQYQDEYPRIKSQVQRIKQLFRNLRQILLENAHGINEQIENQISQLENRTLFTIRHIRNQEIQLNSHFEVIEQMINQLESTLNDSLENATRVCGKGDAINNKLIKKLDDCYEQLNSI